mgnify:CR=1 FL=1
MKETLRLIICLVTGVAIGWWLSGSGDKRLEQTESNPAQQGQSVISAPAAEATEEQALTEDKTSDASKLSDQEIEKLKLDIEVKKQEINELMAQYEASMDDKDKKAALKQELAVLMEQYNQMVLPLALEQMKAQTQ